MKKIPLTGLVVAGLAFAAAGCGTDHMMDGPGMLGPDMPGATTVPGLVSVTPSPGATVIPAGTAITIRFSHAMDDEMEQFVDLHEGNVSRPAVSMTCGWSSDITTLTCTPHAPLRSQTIYAIHIGGGMRDAAGNHVELGPHGLEMGGVWADQGMMGGSHGGMSLGMMGSGWQHPSNGSYGMVFVFETA